MKAAILGGGVWGQALAQCIESRGHTAAVWSRRGELSLETALGGADAVVYAASFQAQREVLERVRGLCDPAMPWVQASKGMEAGSGLLGHELVEAVLPGHRCVALSGPSYAHEIPAKPTVVTLAGLESGSRALVARLLGSPTLRLYPCEDVGGVLLCGALKNVLALGCGICEGLGLGENARAALLTRGLEEMERLVVLEGGAPSTIMSPAGIGDVMLTCFSTTSRNTALGVAVGRRGCFAPALASGVLAEGVTTAAGLMARMERRGGVEIPIFTAIHSIFHRGVMVEEALTGLLARPLPAP